MSVDIHRAHTADTFTTVVVEYDRFFTFIDKLLVQDIHHFQE